jgi:N-6 DNA Methylase
VELTRRQRNDLFEVLRSKGLNPADCKLDTSGNDVRILHPETRPISRPNRSSFTFKVEPSRYVFQWRVIEGPNSGAENACKNWDDLLEQVGYWAEEVQYVTDVPDLWSELRQVPELLTAAQDADASNAPFTVEQQAEIAHRLDEVKRLAREQFQVLDPAAGTGGFLVKAHEHLTDEQIAAIDQRMDEAKETSQRLGRRDWLMAFYGALMSTAMTDAVPPHVIQAVLTTVIHGVAHIFGVGGPPPVITA